MSRRIDDTGNQNLGGGQLFLLPDTPLVLVAGIGALKGDGVGPCFQHCGQDLPKGNVQMVGALIVAPAKMEPHSVRG